MSDIALFWNAKAQAADFGIVANDLATDDGLRTAALLSLFLDRRAEDGDVLPEGETDRRGWWADTDDDKIGSRLWLLRRAKQTPDVLAQADVYAREALRWFVVDKVAESVEVVVEFLKGGGFGFSGAIVRPTKDPVNFHFNRVWEAEARRVV